MKIHKFTIIHPKKKRKRIHGWYIVCKSQWITIIQSLERTRCTLMFHFEMASSWFVIALAQCTDNTNITELTGFFFGSLCLDHKKKQHNFWPNSEISFLHNFKIWASWTYCRGRWINYIVCRFLLLLLFYFPCIYSLESIAFENGMRWFFLTCGHFWFARN